MTGIAIWLYGELIGHLSSKRADHLMFDVAESALERWGSDSVALSIAVPLTTQVRIPADHLRAFFNGLLPEGAGRDELIRRFNLRPRDVIGLLRELGQDCAGAVMALPAGSDPPALPSSYRPLTDADLVDLVRVLPNAPLGIGIEPVTRKSLAGMQPKLLLTRLPDDSWAYSTDGAPSTHILKPEEDNYPGGASNEAWCMRLAKACGLTTVDAQVLDVAGRPVFCVSRYDRRVHGDRIERIHQEDFCQALAIETFDSRAKYGSHNPKRMTLRAMAEVLRFNAPSERRRLLAVTTFNVAIGNADAHGKNHSILHHPDGTISLAPMYDTWSTIQYQNLSRTLSLSIDRTYQLDAVTADRLVAEARAWGVSEHDAADTVADTLSMLETALADQAHRLDLDIGDQFVESISRRILSIAK
jgi:serine/threonine-protein kinase HipA